MKGIVKIEGGFLYSKLITAMKLSIDVLERERRARHAAGEAAYRQGIRASTIEDKEVEGVSFAWVEEAHKEYQKYSQAIETFEDWIEIFSEIAT